MAIFTNQPFMQPILEKYYGKSPQLLKAEQELGKLLILIKNHYRPIIYGGLSDNNSDFKIENLYKMDEYKSVSNLLKESFNFSKFYLSFYQSVEVPKIPNKAVNTITNVVTGPFKPLNAYTVPYTFKFLKYKNNKLDSKSLCVGVNIDVLFISYFDLTAEEVMGIILHEIGHNLDTSMFSYLMYIPINLLDIPLRILAGLYTDVFNQGFFIAQYTSAVTQFLSKKVPRVFSLLEKLTKIMIEIKSLIKIKSLKSPVDINNLLVSMLHPRNFFGYAGEKYADSFATAYGYGEAVVTAQGKFAKRENFIVDKTIKDIPGLNWCYDLLTSYIRIVLCATDPHPQDISRMQSQLLKLKRDIEDPDLNPDLKIEIQDQISHIEKYINDFIDIDKNENTKKIFSWLYNYVAIKVFNGKVDYRELLEKIWPHEE
jgi:hypothetical protein